MIAPPLATGTPALWYLSRGSGAVSLILFSSALILGIVDQRRWRTPRWPRFALHGLHRWISLFALAFLSIHILSGVLDSYAPIRLVDAVVPFIASYRPVWLGFGALALDILLAVTVTGLLKKRMNQRVWRAVHWLSYAAWPVAVVHGLGTGSDVKAGWLLAVTLACIVAVWIAVVLRVIRIAAPRVRIAGFGALAGLPLAAALWVPQGPLAAGWARRAGTPARLLFASNVTPAQRRSPATPSFSLPFSAYLDGTASQTSDPSGLATVDLSMHLSGGAQGAAEVVLRGTPLDTGGLSVQKSQVTFGPPSDPTRYRGSVTRLNGTRILAHLTDHSGHIATVDFRIALEGSNVRGTVSAVPH